jgi:hypothetical protein
MLKFEYQSVGIVSCVFWKVATVQMDTIQRDIKLENEQLRDINPLVCGEQACEKQLFLRSVLQRVLSFALYRQRKGYL